MVLLKSFFRRKTTKLYIIIFIILSISFVVSSGLKKYFIEFANSNYKGSLVYVNIGKEAQEKLNSINNISNIYQSVEVKIENVEYIFINTSYINYEDNLDKYDILVPNLYINDIKIGDKININDDIELTVKGYFDSSSYPFVIIANEELINYLIDNDIGKNAYTIVLENWLNRDDTFNELTTTFNLEYITMNIVYNHNVSLDFFVKVFNVLMNIIVLLFVIIFIATIYSIINDELKNQLLYKCMGYTKINLIKLISIKLLLILTISILSYIISTIIFNLIIITL
jgi:hypothetical protein